LPIGFVDDDPGKLSTSIQGIKVLGTREQIPQLVEAYEVLEFENSRNPFAHRKGWVSFYLGLAKDYQELDESIRKRALVLESQRLEPFDALHLACAEEARAEYFITCDDRIIKRYQGEALKVMNPVNFVISEVIGDGGDQGKQ